MRSRYKALFVIPIVVIVVSLYLIGLNYFNKYDRVDEIRDAVPAASVQDGTEKQSAVQTDGEKLTEAQENAELEKIGDKININTAEKSELMLLDGIGEVLAERIISKREEIGGFGSIEEIKRVNGIGDGIFNKIKNYIKTQ